MTCCFEDDLLPRVLSYLYYILFIECVGWDTRASSKLSWCHCARVSHGMYHTGIIWCVCLCVTYNKGVGSGFGDVYNYYRIMIKRLLPK